jgi:hypothetical protein
MLGGCCCGADTDDGQTPGGSGDAARVLFSTAQPLLVQNNGPAVVDLLAFAIPAGLLQPDDILHVRLGGSYQNSSGAVRTPTWQAMLSAAPLWQDDWGGQGSSALDRVWSWTFDVAVETDTLVSFNGAPLESPTNVPTVGLGAIDNVVSTAVPNATVVGGVAVPSLAAGGLLSVNFNHPNNINLQRLVRTFASVQLLRAA